MDKEVESVVEKVNRILKEAKSKIENETGVEVIGMGAAWDNGEYEVALNCGIYRDIDPISSDDVEEISEDMFSLNEDEARELDELTSEIPEEVSAE
ncbi:hypothetical protein [Methanococcus maripaludis]|uniref:Uncharacterized protein n=1 Tax=Methanococcus maripaludis TaxID=39152 RepID=A0A8T3W0D4_METMI|nr:hypothetical protein [Methanococcus maripaludis]MBG0769671.1 hypothetical protein [Methanococcus maripaludis]